MRQDLREKRDIENMVESNDLDVSQYPVSCSCQRHKSLIREGNTLYIVLSNCSGIWSVDSTVCQECSVRSSMEKIQDECKKAVVETQLRMSEGKPHFESCDVLELTT